MRAIAASLRALRKSLTTLGGCWSSRPTAYGVTHAYLALVYAILAAFGFGFTFRISISNAPDTASLSANVDVEVAALTIEINEPWPRDVRILRRSRVVCDCGPVRSIVSTEEDS